MISRRLGTGRARKGFTILIYYLGFTGAVARCRFVVVHADAARHRPHLPKTAIAWVTITYWIL